MRSDTIFPIKYHRYLEMTETIRDIVWPEEYPSDWQDILNSSIQESSYGTVIFYTDETKILNRQKIKLIWCFLLKEFFKSLKEKNMEND
jgi:predicted oxidoreductase (fatty acid repression mutant protein)